MLVNSLYLYHPPVYSTEASEAQETLACPGMQARNDRQQGLGPPLFCELPQDTGYKDVGSQEGEVTDLRSPRLTRSGELKRDCLACRYQHGGLVFSSSTSGVGLAKPGYLLPSDYPSATS